MWRMIGILAELERSLIQERTKAGRAAVVVRGVKMGRKKKPTPKQGALFNRMIEQGEHPDTVAQSFNVSTRTLRRVVACPPLNIYIWLNKNPCYNNL